MATEPQQADDGDEKPRKKAPGRPRLPLPGDPDERRRRSRRNPGFGMKIRRLRVEGELSQADLSKEFEFRGFHAIDKTTISRLENGIQTPMCDEITAYADFFAVDIDWLVRDELTTANRRGSYQRAIELMRLLSPQEAERRLNGLQPFFGSPGTRPMPRPVDPDSEEKPAPPPRRKRPKGNDPA